MLPGAGLAPGRSYDLLMENSEARIRELRAEMNDELRVLRKRVWELELRPLRMLEYAVYGFAAVMVAITALILAGYG
jgi:hypothetical protein